MKTVTVLDYGRGNLFSIDQALRKCGAETVITSDPAVVARAERVILPGVGAFGDGMDGLRQRGLIEPIKAYCASGRPLLGICLGMQLLLEESFEFGRHEGLGILPGRVVRLSSDSAKVPHVGWNTFRPAGDRRGTALDGLDENSFFYFVHSYAAAPARAEHRLGMTAHGDAEFCSVLRVGNIMGCQFHPEKSGESGICLLKNWLDRN